MLDIPQNLSQIRNQMLIIATNSGRNSSTPKIIAVSKTRPVTMIQQAYTAGQRDFAENYVQEALDKIHAAKAIGLDICWHFIGQIQSNKCRALAENFTWIHSLSSLKHAQRLDRWRPESSAPLQTCIQVSLEPHPQRGGLALHDVADFAATLIPLKQLQLRGLMCVLPETWHGEQAYAGFLEVEKVFNSMKTKFPKMDQLSMGMSGDYPQAIQAGATMLRLGSAVFGKRT